MPPNMPRSACCHWWRSATAETSAEYPRPCTPDTGLPTVFVYDGHAGGAGFADRGHSELSRWLTATRDAILSCECAHGCPSCVYSPKCGNGNDPLDKDGAVKVLTAVIDTIS